MVFEEGLNTISEKLEELCHTRIVTGEPIHVGEVVIIPVIEVVFGFGTSGSLLGMGARIAAGSFLVIKDREVSLLTISDKHSAEKAVEFVPEVMEKYNNK